jgi:DNA-directed RNA polymerase subunit alpha
MTHLFLQTAKVLPNLFLHGTFDHGGEAMGTRIPLNRAELAQQDMEEKLDMSIAEIGLSVRTTNCLEEHGILTVRDLLQRRPKDLLAIPNFGEKTLEEVYKALEGIGFYRPHVRPPEGGGFCVGNLLQATASPNAPSSRPAGAGSSSEFSPP